MNIGPYKIGNGRAFIIAEAGVNHNGDVNIAKQIIDAAIYAGADAIKFQSFQADHMCDKKLQETKDIENLTKGSKSAYDMYKALELNKNDHMQIFDYASQKGIICFSSVFHPLEVDLLVSLKSKAIKISSGDINYELLIEKAAKTKLPLIISTGMATLSETAQCYENVLKLNDQLILLHCISEYPTPVENANLKVIPQMKQLFSCPIGFSDHSEGTLLSEAAVTLGADVIEKHFTLDNEMEGPDHKLSLNPDDFKHMVKNIRKLEKALGLSYKQPTEQEWNGRFPGRRGIKSLNNLHVGDILKAEDLIVIKPSQGLSPKYQKQIIGMQVTQEIKRGTPLKWEYIKEKPS